MATLSTLIGPSLHEIPLDESLSFIEELRDRRSLFSEAAYEFRMNKRKKSSKPPSPKIEAIMDEDFEL